MKIALIISTLIILLLGFLITKQWLRCTDIYHEQVSLKDEIKSYERLTAVLLKAEDRQFGILKEQLSKEFKIRALPINSPEETYGITIWRKDIIVSKMFQYRQLELRFDKEDQLISVRTHTPKE